MTKKNSKLHLYILFFIIFFTLSYSKLNAFYINITPSVAIAQFNYTSNSNNIVIPRLDLTVPVYGKVGIGEVDLGIGFEYLTLNLGDVKLLDKDFGLNFQHESKNKNAKLSVIPIYIMLKYRYYFENKLSISPYVRIGLAYSDNKYHEYQDTNYNDEVNDFEYAIIAINNIMNVGFDVTYNNFSLGMYYSYITLKNNYNSGTKDLYKESYGKASLVGFQISYLININTNKNKQVVN